MGSMTPCKGPVTLQAGFGDYSFPYSSLIPATFGRGGLDWYGGISAIYGNISDTTPAVLAEVKGATHNSIAYRNGQQAQEIFDSLDRLKEASTANFYLGFNRGSLPLNYTEPTLEYTVYFFQWALEGNQTAYDMVW